MHTDHKIMNMIWFSCHWITNVHGINTRPHTHRHLCLCRIVCQKSYNFVTSTYDFILCGRRRDTMIHELEWVCSCITCNAFIYYFLLSNETMAEKKLRFFMNDDKNSCASPTNNMHISQHIIDFARGLHQWNRNDNVEHYFMSID